MLRHESIWKGSCGMWAMATAAWSCGFCVLLSALLGVLAVGLFQLCNKANQIKGTITWEQEIKEPDVRLELKQKIRSKTQKPRSGLPRAADRLSVPEGQPEGS